VTEWSSPGGPKSQPYGIAVIHDVIWYSESGGGVVRNMSPTAGGDLAITCRGVNRIGLVETQP
jgi:virginiamycin B lyase